MELMISLPVISTFNPQSCPLSQLYFHVISEVYLNFWGLLSVFEGNEKRWTRWYLLNLAKHEKNKGKLLPFLH